MQTVVSRRKVCKMKRLRYNVESILEANGQMKIQSPIAGLAFILSPLKWQIEVIS